MGRGTLLVEFGLTSALLLKSSSQVLCIYLNSRQWEEYSLPQKSNKIKKIQQFSYLLIKIHILHFSNKLEKQFTPATEMHNRYFRSFICSIFMQRKSKGNLIFESIMNP